MVVGQDIVPTLPGRVLAWVEFSAIALVIAALIAICRTKLRDPIWNRTLPAVVFLFVFAIVTAAFVHSLHDDGFIRNRTAVATVIGNYHHPDLPTLTVGEVSQMIKERDVACVDARVPADFALGHLPGAVSLPIYSGLVECNTVVNTIPLEYRVIVYCQSEECAWAEVIGADLSLRGYRRVYIFRGGWNEWESHKHAGDPKKGMQ